MKSYPPKWVLILHLCLQPQKHASKWRTRTRRIFDAYKSSFGPCKCAYGCFFMSKRREKVELALERYLEACLLNDRIITLRGGENMPKYHCDKLREALIAAINPNWTKTYLEVVER